MQIVNGEVYPPTVKDVGADMHYPPHIPESERFAVGHEAFGLVPGLMMYATIWLREHNRVCDVLKGVHPDWDDERLFQTTRLILIGEFEGPKPESELFFKLFGGYHREPKQSCLCHRSVSEQGRFEKEEVHFGNRANCTH